MNLIDEYDKKFQEIKTPFPADIVKWLANTENVQSDIASTLFLLSKEMLKRNNFVESFWALITLKEGMVENSDVSSIDRMLQMVYQKCLDGCLNWLGNEIQCNAEDIPHLEKNIKINLAALLENHPAILAMLLRSAPDRHLKIERFEQNDLCDGYDYAVRDIDKDGQLLKVKGHSGTELPFLLVQDGICCVGLGSGCYITEIFKVSSDPCYEYNNPIPNFEIGLSIIEPSLTVLKANMAMRDMTKLFNAERVLWFLGNQCMSRFESALDMEDQFMPSCIIIVDPSAYGRLEKFPKDIFKKKELEQKKLQDEMNTFYNSRSDDEWRRIYNGKRPIRVFVMACLFTTYQQYSIRDVADGFRDLGHDVFWAIEKSATLRYSGHYVLKMIKQFKPDLIFRICQNRIDAEYLPLNIPFINWQQDILPHNANQDAAASISKKDFIISYKWNEQFLTPHGYPKEKINYLEYWLTNTNIYRPVNLSRNDLKKHGCDIVFVSTNCRPAEAEFVIFRDTIKNKHSIEWKLTSLFFEIVKERFDRWTEYPVTQKEYGLIFEQLCTEQNVSVSEEFRDSIVYRFFMIIGRSYLIHKPLERLAEEGINLGLYGTNWEAHPRLSRFARGFARNGEHLNLIYNAATINYHTLHAMTMHPRFMDAAAAGSFILVKHLQEDPTPVEKFFNKDEDFVFFDGPNDLSKKVAYFLDHPKEREEIAENIHKKVQAFNCREFASSLLKLIAKDPNNIIADNQ